MSAEPRRAAILASLCLLAACQSSPPTKYFALTEIAPQKSAAIQPGQIPIRIERVTIPGELDRLEIVRRTSSNQLQIAVFDRWAAPLEDMIRRVVAADLAARFPAGAVASANEPAVGEPRRHLYIDMQEFSGDEHGQVTLRAAWLLQSANTPGVRGVEALQLSAGDAGSDALAAAMSRALADLSGRIATTLAPHLASEKSE